MTSGYVHFALKIRPKADIIPITQFTDPSITGNSHDRIVCL